MVYTWNLMEHPEKGNLGVLNLSKKGFNLEVPNDTGTAVEAMEIWARFLTECYGDLTFCQF